MANIKWRDVKPIINKLMHENRKIKVSALNALKKLDSTSLVRLLHRRFIIYRLFQSPEMIKCIFNALMYLDTVESWERVLPVYFNENEPGLLPVVTDYIAQIKDQSRIVVALDIFMNSMRYIDDKIFSLLGKLTDKRSIFSFCSRQLNDRDNYFLLLRKLKTIMLLSRYQENDAVNILIDALQKDHEVAARAGAAKALGKTGNKESIPALLKALTDDPSYIVRKSAIESLYFVADKRVTPVLCNLLMEGYIWERSMRITALKILGVVKDKESLTVLYNLFKQETDTELLKPCLEAIGGISDESVIPFLKERIREDRADILRSTAGKILTSLKWKADTDQERIYHDIALHRWTAVKENGLSAIEPLLHILSLTEDGKYYPDSRMIDNVITEIFASVKKVYFGDKVNSAEPDTVLNPLVTNLKRPLKNLRTIILDSSTFDNELLEKFITYLINTLREPFLKDKITVSIIGDQELIHKNMFNMLQNIFKHIERSN
ncbi:MAG: HEAT repeat domain-containing protein [Spirochaetales bacterium]|nr:HEAT repeat domain-containing protein [Spirochaetales bacterium]